jgi:hypothetical protein
VEIEERVAPPVRRTGGIFTWTRLGIVALLAVLVVALVYKGWVHLPDGGKYPRLDHDHDDLMISDAPSGARTLTVLFLGNSFTFTNDLPAMLVDIASSDPGAPVRLQVKAITKSSETLKGLHDETNALPWLQAHHADYVVLQEHSHWYVSANGVDPEMDAYAFSAWYAQVWADALKPLGATPLVFQIWADADGSQDYTDRRFATFGWTSEREAAESLRSTESLASRVGAPVVFVGEAFETARETPGAPDVWGPDRHHPSVAGTYLAALVFYRYLTGRSGAEATYRPFGLSAEDAAKLQRIAAS